MVFLLACVGLSHELEKLFRLNLTNSSVKSIIGLRLKRFVLVGAFCQNLGNQHEV